MLLKSIEQTQIFSMEKYIDNLICLYDTDKLPNKIILSGYKGIGKSVLAYHLINYIFSINEKNPYDKQKFKIDSVNRSFNLVKKNSHPNFYNADIEEDKNNIGIDQIRKIITFCNKSSFNNFEKIVLINNVDKLNKNSANALLKLLEEPTGEVFFILIKDSSKKLIETIFSRCINFNIHLDEKQKKNILLNILNQNFYNNLNHDFKNYFLTPGDYVNLLNFFAENNINYEVSIEDFLNFIISKKLYKNNLYLKNNISLFFELYFAKKFFLFKENISAFNDYKNFIKEINNSYKFNLDLEVTLLQFKKKNNL